MFNYMTAVVFYIPRGAPVNSNPLLDSWLGLLLITINSIAFALLIAALLFGTSTTLLKPLASWRQSGRSVIVHPPAGKHRMRHRAEGSR